MGCTVSLQVRHLVLGISVAVGAVAFFAGAYWARAYPGPAGATKPKLSFAGTLRQNGQGLTGKQTFQFDFKKFGSSKVVCSPTATAMPDSQGAFTAEIDISSCPANLFDGSDVTFDVSVNSTLLQSGVAVRPVPYAKYADAVNPDPDCPVGYARDTTSMTYVMCKKGADEVVKVGRGASAFWIDRYEGSIWQNPDGTGTQY